MELNPDPASTWGANEDYKAAWNEKYGNTAPAGNASKAEWVDYAVMQGADRASAEDMTAAQLKEQYSGAGPVVAPAQGSSLPAAATATDSPEPGAGVDSGTPEGTATTTGTSSAGARGKANG